MVQWSLNKIVSLWKYFMFTWIIRLLLWDSSTWGQVPRGNSCSLMSFTLSGIPVLHSWDSFVFITKWLYFSSKAEICGGRKAHTFHLFKVPWISKVGISGKSLINVWYRSCGRTITNHHQQNLRYEESFFYFVCA